MSYIDRELLLIGVDGCISALHVQAKGDLVQEGAIKLVEETRDYIASLSTADVAPVRHGRWIGEPVDIGGYTAMECSACHKVRVVDDYCSACGAKMHEGEDGQ